MIATPASMQARLRADIVDADPSLSISDLLLLRAHEKPVSIEESLKRAYEDDMQLPACLNMLDKLLLEADMRYAALPRKNLHGMSLDEFSSLYLYTCEWEKYPDLNLYKRLNNVLNAKDRGVSARKWRWYCHHLFAAFRKIPTWQDGQQGKSLFRGVARDLVREFPQKYREGATFSWWGCTSTSTDLGKATQFTGTERGTLFVIENAFSGRLIEAFSALSSEREVIFPPASRFEVLSVDLYAQTSCAVVRIRQVQSQEQGRLHLEDKQAKKSKVDDRRG